MQIRKFSELNEARKLREESVLSNFYDELSKNTKDIILVGYNFTVGSVSPQIKFKFHKDYLMIRKIKNLSHDFYDYSFFDYASSNDRAILVTSVLPPNNTMKNIATKIWNLLRSSELDENTIKNHPENYKNIKDLLTDEQREKYKYLDAADEFDLLESNQHHKYNIYHRYHKAPNSEEFAEWFLDLLKKHSNEIEIFDIDVTVGTYTNSRAIEFTFDNYKFEIRKVKNDSIFIYNIFCLELNAEYAIVFNDNIEAKPYVKNIFDFLRSGIPIEKYIQKDMSKNFKKAKDILSLKIKKKYAYLFAADEFDMLD